MTLNSISTDFDNLLTIHESKVFTVGVNKVRSNAFRLDAEAYSGGGFFEEIYKKNESVEIVKFPKIANIFGFGPFKRTYISDPKYGIPLLTSAEMMEIDPSPKIMAKVDLPNWRQYEVKKGWIVVSCSGTIGNVTMIQNKWNDWAVSQDAIRVIPSRSCFGLIYTYLTLPLVKELMVKSKSGSVIDHIYQDDLKNLDIPLPKREVIDKLNSMISEVLQLREEADKCLSEVNALFITVNGLKALRYQESPCLDLEMEFESSTVSAKEVIMNNDSGSEYRLDAHFYNPLAKLAIKNIKQCKSKVKAIEEVTEQVFFLNRFKRVFVSKDYGEPYLAGKEIMRTRPADLNYLSKSETLNLQQYMLRRGWILVTCSGTIGRACFIWKNFEEYAGTHDLIRIVPDQKIIDGGYLYAFIASEYGYQQILRFRHGSVIDHLTPEQAKKVIVPLPERRQQEEIGDLVRSAYDKRAEAIRLEDEAQSILMGALSK